MSEQSGKYYDLLKEREHTFPSFPAQQNAFDVCLKISNKLKDVTRKGQTNFEFAVILEHRKTREVLILGFRSLAEAIENVSYRLESSLDNLRESLSTELAIVVEEQIRTRDTIASGFNKQTKKIIDTIKEN